MKERPILFSGPMVRALLEGRKTQTRRVITRQGPDFHARAMFHSLRNGVAVFGDSIPDDPLPLGVRCPYAVDRLWVKETWARADEDGHEAGVLCRADGDLDREVLHGRKWKPSIFMPRWASRITLPITSIRVERLCDISEEDAREEGVDKDWRLYDESAEDYFERRLGLTGHRLAFAHLWESINGPGSWAENPFVWVVGWDKAEVRR